jgi:catechol 2,3-dioxygenase-like lactoylglutathione lyase family enzyme
MARMDVGLTHVALPVRDVDASATFYARYARMAVVHTRRDSETGKRVAWLSDGTRPFVIVLIETDRFATILSGWAHLGVGCESRAEVDRLVAEARGEGRPTDGPEDAGPPVGYWAFIRDPDGNNLELSHGQEVGIAVERSASGRLKPRA